MDYQASDRGEGRRVEGPPPREAKPNEARTTTDPRRDLRFSLKRGGQGVSSPRGSSRAFVFLNVPKPVDAGVDALLLTIYALSLGCPFMVWPVE